MRAFPWAILVAFALAAVTPLAGAQTPVDRITTRIVTTMDELRAFVEAAEAERERIQKLAACTVDVDRGTEQVGNTTVVINITLTQTCPEGAVNERASPFADRQTRSPSISSSIQEDLRAGY